MILLLGGTSSTAPIALGLARRGYRVLVSRATDIELDIGDHPNIRSRSGPLDEQALAALVDEHQVRAVIDATHPYAITIRRTARHVAAMKGVSYLSFGRPPVVDPGAPNVELVRDHAAAAVRAFSFGQPVLLTTGVRNLAPYARQSRRSGVRLVVRVLDRPESIEACRAAGIAEHDILAGRGPYSVEENRRHLRQFQIGVLVTKDSGQPGGTMEKIEAARLEGCRIIVVARPDEAVAPEFTRVDELLEAVDIVLRT